MATVKVLIEFDSPLNPETAALITDLISAGAQHVIEAAKAQGEELVLTQAQEGEAWKLKLAPKGATAGH